MTDKKSKQMDDTSLLAMIRAYRADSLGPEDGQLARERAQAMDHYYGRPYGDELEGRSQVVSKDLAETVDWILPSVLKPFVSGDQTVEFDATGPGDEDQAKQETDYTNYVIERNDRWTLFHDWFKDALLLKNGYVKHWWETYDESKEERYEGLSEDELAQLMADYEEAGATVEITGKDERQITAPPAPPGVTPAQNAAAPDVQLQRPKTVTVYDVTIEVTNEKGRVCIECVAPENMRISKRCRGGLQQSPFTEYVDRKSRTELIEMGMPEDFVNDLPAYEGENRNMEQIARSSLANELDEIGTDLDHSMDLVMYTEAAVRVDYDGDGRAELRLVVTAGDKIVPGEKWNTRIDSVPFSYIAPKRMPHRHIGESVDDDLADLQHIKTALLRQLLDNVYLTNNQQLVVNDDAVLDDFMRSVPGGIKRVKGQASPQGSVMALEVAPILQQILPAIDHIDSIKEHRTGVNDASTGLDPDVLKQATAGAINENLGRASQKVEMIARLFAEGVKDMVLEVHKLILMHQDEAQDVKLRGKWVNVNPREWKERTDLTVNVGLGNGTESDRRQKLMLLMGLQDKAAQLGLVSPQKGFQMFSDIAQTLGFQNPEKWVMDPSSEEFQQWKASQPPPQPAPAVQAAQITGDSKVKVATLNAQAEKDRLQLESTVDVTKHANDHQRKAAMDAGSLDIEKAKMILDFVASVIASEEASKTPAGVTSANVRTGEADARNIIQGAA